MARPTLTQAAIFTAETFSFLSKNILPKGKRILEAGCGEGDLALKLTKSGALLTAIDTDARAIGIALKKDVEAKNIDFLSFKDGLFDAILFTRSLHHIHDLKAVVEHSALLLKRGGKIIIEEFAVENIDLKTATWYYDTRRLMISQNPGETIDHPLQKWHEDHDHTPPLHTATAMLKHIKRTFKNVHVQRNAYLFRSIGGRLQKDQHGYDLTKSLLKTEEELIKNKLILPVGIRIVAQK